MNPVPEEGGSVERLPIWAGGLLGLAVTAFGSLPGLLLAALGDNLVTLYLGVGGMVVAGIAGMAVVWYLPPADLSRASTSTRSPVGRQARLDARPAAIARPVPLRLGVPEAGRRP